MSAFEATFDVPVTWGAKQWSVLNFRSPTTTEGEPQIEIVAILGEFGGGKTFVAAGRFLIVCLENPFEPEVHAPGNEPLSAIVAPTLGDLKKGPLVQFLSICPEELILKTRLYAEHQDITLINGHRILLYSAQGALNGPSLCQLWADEIQERCYEGKWDNLQGRVRDKRARRLNAQVSGIAQRGYVEDIFRDPDLSKGNRCTMLLFPEDNATNLAPGYVDELKASLPASRERDADGWLLPQGARYPKFSTKENMCRAPDLVSRFERPTSMGVDIGTHAAVVFAQDELVTVNRGELGEREELGQLVVGQLMPDNMDSEELADFIRRKAPWRFVPGQSVIAIDPTAETDQVRHFERAFPGVTVTQAKSGFYHSEENGIRAVDRGVRDLHGNVRLFVHPALIGDSPRGVPEMFRGYLELRPKDKWLEHAADAVRYIVQVKLPLPETIVRAPVIEMMKQDSALYRGSIWEGV